jgi:predicted N-acetyltransferase YhbS
MKYNRTSRSWLLGHVWPDDYGGEYHRLFKQRETFMVQIRRVQAEEYQDAVKLANETFRGNGGKSMGTTYPMAFFPGFYQSYGAFEDGRLVSFIGLVPFIIWIGPAQLQVYALGAVCTHPDYRGKGYAGMLLDSIIKHMEKANSPLLLVSGDRSLYTRIGCVEFGEFTCYTLDEAAAQKLVTNQTKDISIRQMEAEDWFALRRLSQSKAVRYEQSLWDLATLIYAEAPASNSDMNNQVLVAESVEDGQVCGYVVVAHSNGSNARSAAVVVEWAGSTKAVTALLAKAVQAASVKKLEVRIASQETELVQTLEGLEYKRERNSGTVLITDPELLINQLRPYLENRNKNISDQLIVRQLAEGVQVTLGAQAFHFSGSEFTALVFDGLCPKPIDRLIGVSLRTLFPIPFPHTSGINYV